MFIMQKDDFLKLCAFKLTRAIIKKRKKKNEFNSHEHG